MSDNKKADALRQHILSNPDSVLEDPAILQALVAADERTKGENVVDLRSVAMNRLQGRLQQLEDTHRSVVSAVYENIAGMHQIHRAILELLEPIDFKSFIEFLDSELANSLNVDQARLCLQSPLTDLQTGKVPAGDFGNNLVFLAPGQMEKYITGGRNLPVRDVSLRRIEVASVQIFGPSAPEIKSEALLLLDLGGQNAPGLLVLGAANVEIFDPDKATDLLGFFAGVFERNLRRWLV